MERAAHLLRDTELKIAEISGQLGFLAPPHFIKIFKSIMGVLLRSFVISNEQDQAHSRDGLILMLG
ncbi:helix-turn-helix transcriptional regulator [Cohnella fermenti]|uniref:HTH araC/xylS-type domain-containing protein n=1 Tax=Cohnella fermenti TaxID=2565925 RepID=A0A4S4BF99_9BACL|nr:hypothetical protein E6C55_31325 [Cohnella fermenti]